MERCSSTTGGILQNAAFCKDIWIIKGLQFFNNKKTFHGNTSIDNVENSTKWNLLPRKLYLIPPRRLQMITSLSPFAYQRSKKKHKFMHPKQSSSHLLKITIFLRKAMKFLKRFLMDKKTNFHSTYSTVFTTKDHCLKICGRQALHSARLLFSLAYEANACLH